MFLVDLFSGMGGFAQGAIEAGVNISKHYYSEIDKYAISVYRKQFTGAEYVGSVVDFNGRDVARREGERIVVTAGFPCQDLSLAGKRAGFKGSRSVLFFEALRIVDELKPDYFIFENVKGLFSSHDGKDFLTVLREIANIDYYAESQLLNTKWFLPQNRERVYLIGYPSKPGGSRREVFPIGEELGMLNKSQRKAPASGKRVWSYHPQTSNTLSSRYGKDGATTLIQVGQIGEKDSEAHRVYSTDGIARTIKDGDGMGAKMGLYDVTQLTEARTERARKVRKENLKQGIDFSPRREKELVPRNDGLANTVTANQGKEGLLLENKRIRRLSPIETERLQGFSDNWTKYGIDEKGNQVEISDTQRYKMTGNAVSVPVVREIFKRLKDKL